MDDLHLLPFDGFKICGHINRDVYAVDPTVYFDETGFIHIGELVMCGTNYHVPSSK